MGSYQLLSEAISMPSRCWTKQHVEVLPKEYLLENVSTLTLNQIWTHLSEELKKDEELQSRLPCLEHYNRDDAIVHIDGPPPAKYRCMTCRNIRQGRNSDKGSRSLG